MSIPEIDMLENFRCPNWRNFVPFAGHCGATRGCAPSLTEAGSCGQADKAAGSAVGVAAQAGIVHGGRCDERGKGGAVESVVRDKAMAATAVAGAAGRDVHLRALQEGRGEHAPACCRPQGSAPGRPGAVLGSAEPAVPVQALPRQREATRRERPAGGTGGVENFGRRQPQHRHEAHSEVFFSWA